MANPTFRPLKFALGCRKEQTLEVLAYSPNRSSEKTTGKKNWPGYYAKKPHTCRKPMDDNVGQREVRKPLLCRWALYLTMGD